MVLMSPLVGEKRASKIDIIERPRHRLPWFWVHERLHPPGAIVGHLFGKVLDGENDY